MKLLAARRQKIVVYSIVIVMVLGTFGVAFYAYRTHQKAANSKAHKILTDNDLKQTFSNAEKYVQSLDAAKADMYKKTEGITTVADFEKRFNESEREQFVMLTLERLIQDKKYADALEFMNYAESHYAKIAQTIDFEIKAYNVAKTLNKPDVQAKYKAKAEATLRNQGVIGKDDSLSDGYFTSEGQSEPSP